MTKRKSKRHPTFNTWFKDSREQRGLSLRKVEALTGIGNTALSYIEKHGKSVKLSDFIKICEAFDENPTEVLQQLGYL